MPIRQIRQTGDEILRKKSKDVLEVNDKIKQLIEDMKETMEDDGGCGLAAVQVGMLKNIIVVKPEEEGETYVFINPELEFVGEEKDKSLEGCLSVEGKRGFVERYKKVILRAKDINMNDIKMEVSDFFARVLQHEVDHLHGILYTDKIVGKLYDEDEIDELMKESQNT